MDRKKKIIRWIGIGILSLFVLFSIISFIAIKINFDDIFGRTVEKDLYASLRYEDLKEKPERELFTFVSGENTLQGYLYGAENTKGLVVVSHGMGGGAENYFSESMYFVEHGYQVFCYDNTGCYQSEGKNCVGLPQSVIDLDAALDYIESQERFLGLPVYLLGHSWGAYAVTSIFNYEGHDIAASVSVAGFNDPATMVIEWSNDMMGKPLTFLLRPYLYIYQKLLFGGVFGYTAVGGINSTDTPVLLIHGDADTTILIDGAATVAYMDEITNPNVERVTWTKEGRNGHSNLFVSDEALAYLEEVNVEHRALYQEYNEEIPYEVDKAFYDKIDKAKISELAEDFMGMILEFYEKN